MTSMNRLLTGVERTPHAAVYRVVLGFVLYPMGDFLRLRTESWWGGTALILAVLVTLRVGPAIARKAFRFPDDVRAVWAERRQLAKRYDSYQWRKLFWLGLGLCGYLALSRDFQPGRVAPALACLLGGVAGSLIWAKRRRGAEVQDLFLGILEGD